MWDAAHLVNEDSCATVVVFFSQLMVFPLFCKELSAVALVSSQPVTWRTLWPNTRDKDNILLISGERDLPEDRLSFQNKFQFGSRGRDKRSGCLKRLPALTFMRSAVIGWFLTRLLEVWLPHMPFPARKQFCKSEIIKQWHVRTDLCVWVHACVCVCCNCNWFKSGTEHPMLSSYLTRQPEQWERNILGWILCIFVAVWPFSSFFIAFRNQAMRKKLILYFKRRNHARKQWVSRELLGPRPWQMGQLLLQLPSHEHWTEDDLLTALPPGREKQKISQKK